MIKSKLGLALTSLLIFVAIAATAIAQAPEITPFDSITFIEGMEGSYQVDVDNHGDTLRYTFSGTPAGFSIDPNTAIITYTPQIGEGDRLNAKITAINEDDEETTHIFDILVKRALIINTVEVGSTNQNSVQVVNNGKTIPFHPGDDFFVNVNIKNQYTLNNNPFLNTPIRPTFESISLKVVGQSPLTIINGNYQPQGALAAQSTHTFSFQHKIPHTILEGNYRITFTLNGDDQAVPFNSYRSIHTVFVPIERNPHDLTLNLVTPSALADDNLSCQESSVQLLETTVANIGQANELIDLIISDQQGNEVGTIRNMGLLTGEEKKVNITTNLPRNNVNTLTLKAFRTQDYTTALAKIELSYNSIQCQNIQVLSKSPADDIVNMHISGSQFFSLNINNPSNVRYTLHWELDTVIVSDGPSYTLSRPSTGEHRLRAIVNKDTPQVLVKEWTIVASNLPANFSSFPGPHTTDPDSIANPQSTPLTLENANGMIIYDQNVDISNIINLASVVSIQNGRVGINSVQAPTLNRAATITLYRTYTNPKILVQSGFNEGNLVICRTCQITENANGHITFRVSGFSTYVVVEDVPASITISDILINTIKVGQQGNVTVTITNSGSEDLTNLNASLSSVDQKYSARLTGSLPAILRSGEQTSITLTLTVPQRESQSPHVIGSVVVMAQQTSQTKSIVLDPASFLTIDSVKINGKTSGKLKLTNNIFEVRVRNDYSEDIEDVTVTVRILDVDSDNIEEEANSFDLSTGNDKKATVQIDLSSEDLDEDSYTIEIEVEGDADDGTTHETTIEKRVSVDRENHYLFLSRYNLYPTQLSCERQASIHITIENQGKNDENNVALKIRNDKLSLSDARTSIDLNDFSSSDNEYSTVFPIDTRGAPAGAYPITIELFRDDNLEETQTVTLTVTDCTSINNQGTSSTTYSDSSRATQLQRELDNSLAQRTGTSGSSVSASFRDTTTYVLFLGVLIFLVLIAVILAVAVSLKRK